MDFIQRAIENKKHISKVKSLNSQTWQEFEARACHKKVVLFGAGAGADFFLEHYKEIMLEGVIDNDIRKQGFRLDVFCDEAKGEECGRLKVSSIDLLKEYHHDDVCILITSTNYYEQIIATLEQIDITDYFVLLIMEANKRKQHDCVMDNDVTLTHAGYAKICCLEKLELNKIAFWAFNRYTDHGKYITEALLKLRMDLDLVWFVDDMTIEVPKGVRKVYAGNWKRFIYEIETSHVWIFNVLAPAYLIKRQGQIYIQTKHWASVTLKKFYMDSATTQDVAESVALRKYNSEIIDYIITGSDFDTQSCRRGFGFQKEVWQIGSPRSDALFGQDSCKGKIYNYYHLRPDVRTLIYAPTYRFDKSKEGYLYVSREIDLDFEGVKRALEKRFGGEWYIILRLHPGVTKESDKIKKPDFVIDASSYVDGEELVSACDIMISDYSSIMFEPAFVRKPVFLFATDRKDYIDQEYDLLIDYDTLPFPIAESNEELMRKIEEFQQDEYEDKVDAFMEQYGVHEDGHASERAAVLISELMDKQTAEID